MIEKYADFIKGEYEKMFPEYSFQLHIENKYFVYLATKNVTIEFLTERYEKGVILNLVNNKTKDVYELLELAMRAFDRNEPFSFLSESENLTANDFQDEIKEIIYVSTLILDKFGRKILEGDFTELED